MAFIALGTVLILGNSTDARSGDKVPAVKEISLKGLQLDPDHGGPLKKPAVINNAEELTKALFRGGPVNKNVLDSITRQVDFEKQQLLFFRWAGSGQDRIAGLVQKTGAGEVILFQYTPGLTRDYRQHAKLFAIARGMKWEMKTVPFKGK